MTPLIRTGPKGEGRFRAASWDEALDLVASRIADAVADDPATVVPYLYNSSAGELGGGLLGHFLWDALGTSHVEHTICAATTGRAWAMTFGSMPGADLFDVVHAQLVVVWGANPAISNTHFPPLVQHARANGGVVVVVDPRRTAMAKRADLHLAVRPGHRCGPGPGRGRRVGPTWGRRHRVHRRPCRGGRGVPGRVWAVDARPGRRAVRGRPRRSGSVRRSPAATPAGLLADRLGHGAQPQRRLGGAGGAGPPRPDRGLRPTRLGGAPPHRPRPRLGHRRALRRRARGARGTGSAAAGAASPVGEHEPARPAAGGHRARSPPSACCSCRGPTRRP